MAAGRVGGGIFIERPEVAVGVHAGGTDVDEALAWCIGALDHGPGVVQGAAGAVDDHVEMVPLELVQVPGLAPVPLEVLHPVGERLPAAGEQGEPMACREQCGHQGATDEPGSPHHQNLQGARPATAAPFKRCVLPAPD